METTVSDASFDTVFQSLRLHLSTPETERSQNGAFSSEFSIVLGWTFSDKA